MKRRRLKALGPRLSGASGVLHSALQRVNKPRFWGRVGS